MCNGEDILLGLDLGYTGCKAIAFNGRGEVLGGAYREYPMDRPQPGWVEMDPDRIWSDTADAIREVTAGLPGLVTALSVAVMGEAFTPVDRHGRPVTPTFTAFDERGGPECERIVGQLGADRIFELTGQIPGPSYPLAKMSWLRENRPDVYDRVDTFFCWGELVLHRLGVEPVIDYTMAARTMAFDVHQLTWSEEVLEAAKLDPALLPRVGPAGTPAGCVSAGAAEELGLSPSTMVVVGGHDQACGAVGAGAISGGQATYALGTVHVICAVMDRFERGLGEAGFPCYPHVVPGRYITIGYNFTGGSLLRWFRDTLASADTARARADGRDPYDVLLADLPDEPTDLFVVPHFSGTGTPWFDTGAKGSVVGLTLATERGQIIKAILEGTTYELAFNLHLLEQAVVEVNELRVIGGSAKSDADVQLRTDVMNRRVVTMKISEAPALGAAILAGVGTEVYPSVQDAVAHMTALENTFDPDPSRAEQYAARRNAYQAVHPLLRDLYGRLRSIESDTR